MPHPSSPDSVFGLYWGRLKLKARMGANSSLDLKWRAEVPWEWPSYESLNEKYGTPHAERFPIPNLMAVIMDRDYSLKIDNGLGEYLTRLGLAKVFLAYSEWTESI